MLKFKETVLLLCLTFSGAFCFANGEARTGKEKGKDGIPIDVIEKSSVSSSDKSGSIKPTIDGHFLTVVFTENLGQVVVDVTTTAGAIVEGTITITPTGIQIYIPFAGDYYVNFTLPNGDEYYGEFTITD